MKYISLVTRYYEMLLHLEEEKLNMTPKRVERVMFMCNEEMKRRKKKRLYGSKVYFSPEGHLEIPYISRIVRISPLTFMPTYFSSLIFVVNKTHINYMKKLLKLPENEFNDKFEKEIEYYCKNNKVRTYNMISYKKWVFMGRKLVFGQVHPVLIVIWLFSIFLYPFFVFITFLESLFLLSLLLTMVLILFTYLLFRKKSIFETGMLGNDDDTYLSLESYKEQLKVLKKEGRIKSNRF